MKSAFSLLGVALALTGLLAGYLTTPRYSAPPQADEARLKERALRFYRASKLLNMGEMIKFYTPAHQLQKDSNLADLAKTRSLNLQKVDPAKSAEFLANAQSLTAEMIEVKIEGDWAVTSGEHLVPASAKEPAAKLPLQPMVWHRVHGDWWVYLLEVDELACYGNAPDFARDVLARRNFKPMQLNVPESDKAVTGEAGAQNAEAEAKAGNE